MGANMQVNAIANVRSAARVVARQIPRINALIEQRDSLVKENTVLKQQIDRMQSPDEASRRRHKHFVEDYQRYVRHLIATHPIDDAMSAAVGGSYDKVGTIEVEILRDCGFKETHSLIDLGCGSGRLAKHIGQNVPHLNYLGIDVVPELLAYAAKQSPSLYRTLSPEPSGT
jgi:tRNA G46 methylase TrmB